MFQKGNIVGMLFHLEVTGEEASLWADEYAHELDEIGKSKAQVVAECREREKEMRKLANRLMDNYFQNVLWYLGNIIILELLQF